MTAERIILLCGVVAYTSAALWTDLRSGKLPNVLTVSSFLAALIFHVASGAAADGWSGAGRQLLFSLAGFGAGFGILFVLWLIGGGGGGDVKFMGALGAWLGAKQVLAVFLVSGVLLILLAGAVLAKEFIRLGAGRAKERYLTPAAGKTEKQKQRRGLVRFGLPATLATWLVLAIEFTRHLGT